MRRYQRLPSSPALQRLLFCAVLISGGCNPRPPEKSPSIPVADRGSDTFETADVVAPQARVGDTLPRSLRPNEPAGFIPFAMSSGSHVPERKPGDDDRIRNQPAGDRTSSGSDDLDVRGSTGTEDLGRWYTLPLRNPRLRVVEDPTAPVSPPYVMRVGFPSGWVAGRGPVTWGGWDRAGKHRTGQKEKVYFSMWLKLDGSSYENQAVGTKMGFFGAATPTTYATHNTWFFLKGTGRQTTASEFRLEVHQSFDGPGGPRERVRSLPQNVDRSRVMTAGVWHQWEAVLELNTPGQSNGVFKWWIDGRLVMSYSNMTYTYGDFTNGFYDFNFNPTWGGTGGVKSKDDAILIDHIYMSGIPMTSQGPEPVDRRRRRQPQNQ
jgi:hypothetical protein